MRACFTGKSLVYILLAGILLFIFESIDYEHNRVDNEQMEILHEQNLSKKMDTEIMYIYTSTISIVNDIGNEIEAKTPVQVKTSKPNKYDDNLKYILLWTTSTNVPFIYMGKGRDGFIQRNCSYTNCFVTDDDRYFGYLGYTRFDVIAFAGPEMILMPPYLLPVRRSPHQKYAYVSIESADNYPLCSNRYDEYFNWTWTYKLDSDTRWGYIVVRDKTGRMVGPNKGMHWMKWEDMLPVTDELKEQLRKKTKMAAWFVSNCRTRSRRERFVAVLRSQLKKHSNMTLDIYGKCSHSQCPSGNESCNQMIRDDYFFYLSFENAFSEDYVTEKLLHAVQNNAIPVVYGGADYSR